MTNLSTLSGRLLDIELGTDDSTVLFTTARREAAINEGVREFAALTECWTRQASFTVTSTQYSYNLGSTAVTAFGTDADFIRLIGDRSVEFGVINSSVASTQSTPIMGPEALPQRTIRWLQQYAPDYLSAAVSTSVQFPDSYWLLREASNILLGFYPKPSTGTNSSLEFAATVHYVAMPQRLSTATDEPFSQFGFVAVNLRPYHKAAVHYAAAQLEKLRKNTEASERQMQAFLAYVQRYFADVRQKGGSFLSYARTYLRKSGLQVEDPRT